MVLLGASDRVVATILFGVVVETVLFETVLFGLVVLEEALTEMMHVVCDGHLMRVVDAVPLHYAVSEMVDMVCQVHVMSTGPVMQVVHRIVLDVCQVEMVGIVSDVQKVAAVVVHQLKQEAPRRHLL